MFAFAFNSGTIRAERAPPLTVQCADSSTRKSCAETQDADRYVTWHRELLRPLRLHLDELPDPLDESDVGLSRLDADPASVRVP